MRSLLFLMVAVFATVLTGFGQTTNYVSWDFTPSISSANYSTSTTNQTAARTSALANATLSTISLNGGVTGNGASTLHRTTTWPTTQDLAKYLQYSVTLTAGDTFPNSTVSLAILASVSNTGTAARDYQIQYGWGVSPTFANATNGSVSSLATSASSNTATIPAPGNTTTNVLTIRFLAFGSTASTGSTQINTMALTGSPVISTSPTITSSKTSITARTTTYGTASTTDTFNVSGSVLTNNILLTPPTGFEVSQTSSSSGFTDTQTLVQSSGTVSSTAIYVRLKATAPVTGTYNSQNIVLSSTGAGTVNVTTAGSGNIVTGAPITITGLSAAGKVYDRTTTVSVTGTPQYSGLVNSETFSVTGPVTWAFADKTVAASKSLTRTGSFNTPSTNYTITQPTLTATITAAPLTALGGSVANKVYDRTTAATLTGVTFSGVLIGDTVTVVGTGSFADFNVGTAKPVTATITAGGTDGANYTVTTQPSGLTADITARALTITGLTIPSRVYDGTATAVLSGTAAYSGLASGDSFSVTGTPSASFASSAVGTSKAVTVTGYTAPSSNYTLSQPSSLTGTITAKALSVTGTSIAAKVYDASTASGAVTVGTISGFVGSETVTSTASGVFSSSADVSAGKNVVVTYILVNGTNGGLASNYSLGTSTVTGVITAKVLAITAPTIASKVYNGLATAGAVTVGTLSGFVGTETVTATAAGLYADAAVGTGKTATITYTLANGTNGAKATNYSLSSGTGTGEITKADQTITLASILSKTTTDTDFSPATASSGLTVTYTSSNPNVATIVAGQIRIVGSGFSIITASQAGNANYNSAPNVTSTLTVAASAYSENMGTGSTTTAVPTYTGWQNSSPVTYSSSGVTNVQSDVRNTSPSSGYVGASGSYNVFMGTANSNSRDFLISGINTSGFPASSLTLSFGLHRDTTTNGLAVEISSDGTTFTPITITQPANANTWTLTTATGSIPSTSNLRIRFSKNNTTSFRIDDISLSYVQGATIFGTASTSAFTTTYGTPSTAQTFTVSGSNLISNLVATAPTGFEVASDVATWGNTATFTQIGGYVTGTLSVRLKADAAATGSYNSQNIVLSSTGATNVNITTAASGNLVTPKGLTISGLSGVDKVYNGTAAASLTGTAAYVGLVNGQSFSVTGTPSASFADANIGTAKPITVTGYTAPSTNYTVAQPTGLTADITQATVAPGSVTFTPDGNGGYTAGASGVSGFAITYAGRNGTTYASSSTIPTAPGYYTTTATSTDPNYTGNNTSDYFISGPIAVNDTVTKPFDNAAFKIPVATLLANDSRITSGGVTVATGLSITAVSGPATVSGAFVFFTPAITGQETFTYTLSDGTTTATGTVTVNPAAAPTDFTLEFLRLVSSTYDSENVTTAIIVELAGVPGQNYTIQYSTNINSGWISLPAPVSTGSTGTFNVSLTAPGNVSNMFFRATR